MEGWKSLEKTTKQTKNVFENNRIDPIHETKVRA